MCAEGKQSARAPSDWLWARATVQPCVSYVLRAISTLVPCTAGVLFGRMNDVVACPRGDSCHYCLSLAFRHKYSISGLGPIWDCHYIKVALWMTRSAPFTQLGKTFEIPDLLLYELAGFLV